MNKKILDIGCGINKSENVIGMDISNLSGADIIHDLNKYPYPFDDENFDEIICSDTFILVNNPIKFLREVYRILKPNCKFILKNPYFKSRTAYLDPFDNKRFIGVHYFDIYDPSKILFEKYSKLYNIQDIKFKINKIYFENSDEIDKSRFNFFNKKMLSFSKKYPSRYEKYFSAFYAFESIKHILEKI